MKISDATVNTLRAEMTRCGFTLNSLSEETQISTTVLHGILTSRANTVSTRNVCALARAFGYCAADFVDLLSGNLPYQPPDAFE